MKINADKVRQLRKEKLWSQEQLSEACNISLRTIQRLESSGNASIASVNALASVFEIDTDQLTVIAKEKTMTPLEAVKTGFIKFADFSDTATRFEYWWFFAFVLLIALVSALLNERAWQVISVIVALPLIAVGCRRLNDVGRSGWWQLLFLVPFGQIVVFFMLAQESKAIAKK